MRVIVRSAAVALLVIAGAVLLALTSTMTSVFTLAATTYILKGTNFGVPFCTPYCGALATPQQNIDLAQMYVPASVYGNPVVVNYPASFWPISSGYFQDPKYDDSVKQGVAALPPPGSVQPGTTFFGYSEGANVTTLYKREFNQYYSNPANGPAPSNVSFVLIGNGNRPNGGFLERFNGLYIPGVELSFDGATPTTTAGANGKITTVDIAQQYDGFADFPTNPLNVLADANALAGINLVHLNYQGANVNNAQFQATYGDTAYYLIPTYPLPLLMPLTLIPGVGPIAADMLDPTLRVLVESAYNRQINPGQPTLANIFYFPNPITFGAALVASVPTGLVIGIEDITGQRTPGTPPPYVQGQGTYGLGGPPVTLVGQTPIPLQDAIGSPQQPTPAPDPASTTIPSIPSLLNPAGLSSLSSLSSVSSLLNPTALTSELATFSSLTSILNGGLPVNVASLFNTAPGLTGLPSLLNPMTILTEIVKEAVQNLPSPSQSVAATIASPTLPPAQNSPQQQQSVPRIETAQNQDTISHAWQHTEAQNETPITQNGGGSTFSGPRSKPDTTVVADTPPAGTQITNTGDTQQDPAPKSGPRLNVCLSMKPALAHADMCRRC